MDSRVIYMDLFPAHEKILSIFSKISVEDLLFFDIETTGLSWKDSMVFLIGVLKKEMDKNEKKGIWRLEQWFSDDPSDEKRLLEKFSSLLTENTFLVHYNGQAFDLPFLTGRCYAADLPDLASTRGQLDLYKTLRPYQKLLGLEHLRSSDLDAWLGSPSPGDPGLSGRKCISVYRKYLLEKKPAQKELLFAHNQQDLIGLFHGIQALAYPAFFQGHFQLEKYCLHGDTLSCTLRPEIPLPRPFSLDFAPRPWSVRGSAQQIQMDLLVENGYLKMYHPDPKDYHYLPEEDTAVHKSVGAYVDRRHRRQATAQTCYTRFPCSLDFMQDREKVEAYVRHCLLLERV